MARMQEFLNFDTRKVRRIREEPEEPEGDKGEGMQEERDELICQCPLLTGGICEYIGTKKAFTTHQRTDWYQQTNAHCVHTCTEAPGQGMVETNMRHSQTE